MWEQNECLYALACSNKTQNLQADLKLTNLTILFPLYQIAQQFSDWMNYTSDNMQRENK